METETILHKPDVRRSSGINEEARTLPTSPASYGLFDHPLAQTGTVLPGETHNYPTRDLEVIGDPGDEGRRLELKQTALTFEVIVGLPQGASSSFVAAISSLPDEGYELVKPIPVCVDRIEGREFVASFERAGIAMSGDTVDDALRSLAEHLLDVFESYTEHESDLGASPAKQLTVLRDFIRER
jgi:hypothetical protein